METYEFPEYYMELSLMVGTPPSNQAASLWSGGWSGALGARIWSRQSGPHRDALQHVSLGVGSIRYCGGQLSWGEDGQMHTWGNRILNSLVSVVVSACVAGVVSLVIGLAGQAGLALTIGIALSTAGAILIVGTALVLWYRQSRQTYVSYPFPGFSIRILEKRIRYHVDEAGRLHFSRILKIKALVDNVDRYVDKFVWTGGSSALPIPGIGVDEIRPLGTAGIWTFYDSSFRSLRKGETLQIEATWPELEISGSRPFVSTASDEPTDRIVFDLLIPARFRKDDSAMLEDMRSIESIHPFRTLDDQRFDNKGQLEWSFRPNHYRHYRVRWGWTRDDEVQSMAVVTGEEAQ